MSQVSIHKLGDKEYGLVTVPKDAKRLMIFGNSLRWKIDPSKFWWDQIILPAGQWELVGKGSEVTEEQWKAIVKKYHLNEKYEDYATKEDSLSDLNGFFNPMVGTAKESGLSWLKSLNHDPKTTVIIRKTI